MKCTKVLATIFLGLLISERIQFVISGAYARSIETRDLGSVSDLVAACYGLSVGANIVSTIMIGHKAW